MTRRIEPFNGPDRTAKYMVFLVLVATPGCSGGSVEPLAPCSPASFAGASAWAVGAGGNDHLYEVVKLGRDITWEEALSAATARGEHWHLATVTSAAENAFIEGLLAGDSAAFNCCQFPVPIGRIASGPWLGASSSSNQANDWNWVTGEAFDFADWGPLEPFGNGDHIAYAEFGAGRLVAWNDIPSSHVLGPRAYVRECSPTLSLPG